MTPGWIPMLVFTHPENINGNGQIRLWVVPFFPIFAADEAKNCDIDSDWLFAGFICPDAGYNKTQDH
jgi:hypothetical protein